MRQRDGIELPGLAALLLRLPTLWWRPRAHPPTDAAWWAAVLLALLCTGLAYVLYFAWSRICARPMPSTVTFLTPAFAVAWGWLFLHETVTPAMLAGCAAMLLGTALATGLQGLRRPGAAISPP